MEKQIQINNGNQISIWKELKNNSILLKVIIMLLLVSCNVVVFGQKYTIVEGDTVLAKMQLHEIKGKDTTYLRPCNTFELLNGKVINRQDSNCMKQGFWIINKEGYFVHGYFNDNVKDRKWLYFADSTFMDTVYVRIFEGGLEIKTINFESGKIKSSWKIGLFERFLNKNWYFLLVLLIVLLYSRVGLNNQINNSINHTEIGLIVLFFKRKNLLQLYKSMFFGYWKKSTMGKYPNLRKKMSISNILSILFIIIFSFLTLLSFFLNEGID